MRKIIVIANHLIRSIRITTRKSLPIINKIIIKTIIKTATATVATICILVNIKLIFKKTRRKLLKVTTKRKKLIKEVQSIRKSLHSKNTI
jgi:hypothetical protein